MQNKNNSKSYFAIDKGNAEKRQHEDSCMYNTAFYDRPQKQILLLVYQAGITTALSE